MGSISIKEIISKLLTSTMENVAVISGNHLRSLTHMCLLFVFMQELIVDNMLTYITSRLTRGLEESLS